jgi:hypothetical protein
MRIYEKRKLVSWRDQNKIEELGILLDLIVIVPQDFSDCFWDLCGVIRIHLHKINGIIKRYWRSKEPSEWMGNLLHWFHSICSRWLEWRPLTFLHQLIFQGQGEPNQPQLWHEGEDEAFLLEVSLSLPLCDIQKGDGGLNLFLRMDNRDWGQDLRWQGFPDDVQSSWEERTIKFLTLEIDDNERYFSSLNKFGEFSERSKISRSASIR